MKKYDIIIIGAGCSGLSLAYRLASSSFKVCIFDSHDNTNRIRKTWSYWDVYNHPFKHLEINKNKKLKISFQDEVNLDCSKYNYVSIDSKDFDEFIFAEINNSNNIDIKFNSAIENIEDNKSKFFITSDNEEYEASYIFDSRPESQKKEMEQVFKGLFVKFDHSIENFIPSLMDFSNHSDFHFFYCLPMDKDTYLFETTYFTQHEKDPAYLVDEIHSYIQSKYDSPYQIVREEFGRIPLSTIIPHTDSTSNYTKLGIASGATRASTGYTFLNIQKQCDEYIKKINGEKFIEYHTSLKQVILRKMDNVLLMIIKDHPHLSKSILYQLFEKNNSNTVIRFLSDIPSLVDIVKIIMSMPKLIFIKYAIKSLYTRKI